MGLEGCYLPGTDGLEVGGDWYDALRAYVLEGFSPGEALGKLNHLTLSLSGSTFATVLCLRYEPADVVALYTDGLVEKPGEDIDVSIDALAVRIAALEVGAGFVDAVVAPLTDTDRRDDVAVLVLST